MTSISVIEVEPCRCGCGLGRHLPITGRPCEMCPCERYVKATRTREPALPKGSTP